MSRLGASALILVWGGVGACAASQPSRAPLAAATSHTVPTVASSCAEETDPPEPAYSGPVAELPEVPTLSSRPTRIGDAYTVFGAIHDLRSLAKSAEVQQHEIVIEARVVRTNYAQAPVCAVHRTGKADPEGCRSPVPAIWIADSDADGPLAIKVMGFAANWAQLYEAIMASRARPPRDVRDEFWGVPIPRPVPNVGARVRVHGMYGFSFTKSTTGMDTEPRTGILTYSSLEYLDEPTTPAILPGMKKP